MNGISCALPRGNLNVGRMVLQGVKKAYWLSLTALGSAMFSIVPALAEEDADAAVSADTIWSRFSTILSQLYREIVGISTIVAVTVATIALMMMMFSHDQRVVSESRAWLFRITITFVILNSLGLIATWMTSITNGGNFTA